MNKSQNKREMVGEMNGVQELSLIRESGCGEGWNYELFMHLKDKRLLFFSHNCNI